MKSKIMRGVALVGLAVIIGVTSTLVVMSTPSGKNAGWFVKEYDNFRPKTYVAASLGATSANASIYCPGIKPADHIVMCIEVDSAANALASTVLVNHTDSTYVQDTDSIRIATAITVNSDLIVMWHKSNY